MEEINWDFVDDKTGYRAYFGWSFAWSEVYATVCPFEGGWQWEVVKRRNNYPFKKLLHAGFNHKVHNVTRAVEYFLEEAWRDGLCSNERDD